MLRHGLFYPVYVTVGGLFVLSCAALSITSATDSEATRVAVKAAAAATLTAEAPTEAPTETPTETPVPATSTSTSTPEPTSIPTLPVTPTPPPTPAPANTATAAPTFTPIPLPTNTPSRTLTGRLLFVNNCDGDFEIFLGYLGPNPSVVKLTNNDGANDWFPDWSTDGNRIVFTSNRTGNYDLYTMNADGSGATVFVNTPAWDEYGNWEPGSTQIVFSTTAETNGTHNSELFRRDANGNLTRLTTNQGEDRNPDWHPSGDIYYASNAEGNWDIFVLPAGSGQARNLTDHPAIDEDPGLSPDNNRLVFVRKEADTNGDGQVDDGDTGNIYIMNIDGSGVQAVTATNLDNSPAWSPDGKAVIYARAEAFGSRSSNLYVANLSDGATTQVTAENGCSVWGAAWSQ